MKHTKRLLAAAMALSMVSALAPMSAFAEDIVIKNDSTTQSGTMTATYEIEAKYTVTIPAGVELKSVGEGSVDKAITADDVMLESGKQIVVKLTGGSNTTSGSTFSAKATAAGSSSVATYTISKGETPVAVGDTVATFTSNADEQSETLTFSEASGATDAGEHSETLTFGIAVEDAIQSETISLINPNPDDSEMVTSVTSEHFKVTAGYLDISDLGLTVNKFGAMTIESLNGENITKIELSYAWDSNANTVSVTPGTLNAAYNTISDINATKVTVSSSSAAGVRFNSVKIYYR